MVESHQVFMIGINRIPVYDQKAKMQSRNEVIKWQLILYVK
jgi:hypothetical protein